MKTLKMVGLVYSNQEAAYASVAMAIPKREGDVSKGWRETRSSAKRTEPWSGALPWEGANGAMKSAMTFAYPEADWIMLTVPGTRDLSWRWFLSQAPRQELASGKAMVDMCHRPVAFFSDQCRGAQLKCPTVDKEGLAFLGD